MSVKDKVTFFKRKADSLRRSEMVLYLKSVVEKIVASGIKVTLVPVLDLGAVPIFFKVVTGFPPFSKRCL
ncbi:Uncharacterised protein [Streptococcus pneumoniae]|nr:Uncharacterised protein [Streptococcus pneumoniae]